MPAHPQFDLGCGRVAVHYRPASRLPVLLIHGNSADQQVFGSQIAMLMHNDFGIVALDLPGHGRSEDSRAPSQTYSFPGYAMVVAEVFDRLAIEQVHVAGWSLGGHVGLELMGRDRRVASLFLWGTPPIRPSRAALIEAFLPSVAMDYAGQKWLNAEQVRLYATAMAGGVELDQTSLLAAIRRTDGNARAWMVRNSLEGVGLDARALVQADSRPLAVLHGLHDPFIDLTYLKSLAYRNLWRNKVHVLPGIGHAAHLQTPEAFNALLLSFLLSMS